MPIAINRARNHTTVSMRALRTAPLLSLLTLLAACGDDPATDEGAAAPAQASGGGSAGSSAAGGAGAAGSSGVGGAASAGAPALPEIPAPAKPASPAPPTPPNPPVLTPCPEGWTQTTGPKGLAVCEPGPGPRLSCPEGWAQIEGERGEAWCEPGAFPSWDCAPGWTAVTLLAGTPREHTICKPKLPTLTCDEGAMPVAGSEGCTTVFTPCPAGDFADGLPGDAVHVKAGAAGGDGSAGAPFGDLAAALTAAPEGATIALAQGSYTAGPLSRSVKLVGACTAKVTIAAAGAGVDPSIVVAQSASVTLTGARVTGASGAIRVDAGGSLVARGVLVDGPGAVGIDAAGQIELEDVWVRDVQSDAQKGAGMGISLHDGAKGKATRVTVSKARTQGVLAKGEGTTLEATALLVSATQPKQSDDSRGRGLQVELGATMVASNVVVEGSHDIGVFANGAGATLTLSDLRVTNTQPQASDKTWGVGLHAQSGAVVTVERGLFDDNHTIGVYTFSKKTDVTLRSVVITDTRPQPKDGAFGVGIQAEASAHLSHVLVERCSSVGVYSAGVDGMLDGSHVIVSDTRPVTAGGGIGLQVGDKADADLSAVYVEKALVAGVLINKASHAKLSDVVTRDTSSSSLDGTGGAGLQVLEGSSAEVTRALFERGRGAGAAVFHEGSALTLSGAIIRDVLPQEGDGLGGQGLMLNGAVSASVTDVLIEQATLAGVQAQSGAKLTFEGLTIRSMRATNEGKAGRGINAEAGAAIEGKALAIESVREGAVVLVNDGTTASLSHVSIRGMLGRENDMGGGRGVNVALGASLTMSRALVRETRDVGVVALGGGAKVTASDLIVTGCTPDAATGKGGEGLAAQGGTLTAERALVDDCANVGAGTLGPDSSLTLTDVTISNTNEPGGAGGRGIEVGPGTTVSVSRVALTGNREAAAALFGKGAKLEGADLDISDVTSSAFAGGVGRGINAQDGATATLSRVRLRRCLENGIVAITDASLQLDDVSVEDTAPRTSDGKYGRGLLADLGGHATARRALLSGNHEVGVAAIGQGSDITLVDVAVRMTAPRKSDRRFGRGAGVYEGAKLSIERGEIVRNSECGISARGKATTLSLVDVLIDETAVREQDGEYGVGLLVSDMASFTGERLAIDRSHGVGALLMTGTTAKLQSCEISGTELGKFTPTDLTGVPNGNQIAGVGDGLLLLSGSTLEGRNLSLFDNARAGLLFSDSHGSLESTTSTRNALGLVLRGDEAPTYDTTCVFEGNSQQAILPSGDLPVPTSPLPIPEPVEPLESTATERDGL